MTTPGRGNDLLAGALRAEATLLGRFNVPFGVSIVAAARKEPVPP